MFPVAPLSRATADLAYKVICALSSEEMLHVRDRKSRNFTRGFLTYLPLVLWSFICLFPLYWVCITSLKSGDAVMQGPRYLPFVDFQPTLESWRFILFDAGYNLVHRYMNSVLIGGFATILTIGLALMLIYGLTRHTSFFGSRFTKPLLAGLLFTRLLPPAMLVLPLYLMAKMTGSLDTLTMVVLVYASVNLPVAIWLLLPIMGFRATDQEEAAMLDGTSQWQVLFGILLPMLWGQVCAVAFLILILCWNEFLLAAYLTSDHALTLPPFLVGQMSMKEAQIAGEAEEWAQFSAASVLMMAPLLLGAGWLQRQLGRNLASHNTLSR